MLAVSLKKNPIINYKINDENLKSRHRKLKFSIYGASRHFLLEQLFQPQ